MTTARESVYRALKLIRVTARGATPSAGEAADGLTTLNRMLSSLITLGYEYNHTALGLDDAIDIQNTAGTLTTGQRDGLTGSIEVLLAAEMCQEYGKEITATLQALVTSAVKALNAMLITHRTAETDIGFQYLPSRRLRGTRLF